MDLNQAEDFPALGFSPLPDPRNYPESIQRGRGKEELQLLGRSFTQILVGKAGPAACEKI